MVDTIKKLNRRWMALLTLAFICCIMSLYFFYMANLFLTMLFLSFILIVGKYVKRVLRDKKILENGKEVILEVINNEKMIGPRGLLYYYPVLRDLENNNLIEYKNKRSLNKLLVDTKVKGVRYQNEYYIFL